ncbi:TonB-dependent receptor domain-containing protein [candidate division CSSED10-310 bacterium]|uniref:TonB-dependent receptor domain-containing protein n=1 Tax=candidate division CSSED10-310 bacterium TaxID=2855610 RepID=A0ABV6YSA7_UNCC1
MKKYCGVFVCLCIFSFLLVGSSQAALTGNITGTIVDDTGNPLPGVMVTVQGTGLPGIRSDTTREDGRYRIVLLPPGKYTVKAELPGFKTLERKNITSKINDTTRIDMAMQVSTFEEVVVVTAEAPVLDTSTSSVGVNINREFTERLPASDSFQDAFSMGGSTTGSGNPFVHGGTHVDNVYLFDGIDATDPVTHTFGANLNADAVEEVEVQTGGFSAEYGKAMGGIVNAVTKTGGNKFEGIVRFAYTTDSLKAPYNAGHPGYEVNDHFEPTLSLGGPILKDKIWFFVSYRRSDYASSQDVRTDRFFEEEGQPYELTSISNDQLWEYWVGKLTWSITPSHNLELSWSHSPAKVDNDSGLSYHPEAQEQYEQGAGAPRYGVAWTYIYSSNLYFDTKYGINTIYLYTKPMNDSGLPGVYDRKAKIYYDNYTSTRTDDRQKWSLSTAATYVLDDWKGIHEFKIGAEYQEMESESYFNYSGGRYYEMNYYDRDQNYSYADDSEFGQEPYRYYAIVDPKTDKEKGEILSLYVQDGWEVKPGLTLNIGLRYDQAEYFNKLDESVTKLDGMIAPRFGIAWDINNDGKSKAYINLGRSYNTFDLTIVGANPGPTSIDQEWRYDPEDPNAADDGYYLYGQSGGETSNDRLDDGLKAEYADEILIGYDREVSPNWSAGVMLMYKATRDIIEDVGFWEDADGNMHMATDVDMSDQAAIDEWYDRVDEQQEVRYYYTNPSDAYRDYYSVELHSSARTEKFSFEVSWTYARAEGTTVNTQPGDYFTSYMQHFTVYYDTPYLSNNIDGRLYYDVPNYLKISGSYRLPLGFVIGTRSWWKSGYMYEKYGSKLPGPDGEMGTEDDINNEDPRYGDGCRLPDGRGAGRLPDVVMVEFSVQKDFDFGKWGMLTAIVDIDNFLNNQVNLSRVEDEDDWGREDGWAGPTNISFQLRYEF